MFEKKLSKRESTALLLSIESQLFMGASLPVALKNLAKIEKKEKRKSILQRIIHFIYSKNMPPEEALFLTKVINGVEKQILEKTQSTRAGIEEIVKLRDMSKGFEKTMFKIFTFPILALPIGLMIDFFIQPQFYEMYISLIKQVIVLKNIDLSKDIQLMWYLMDRMLLVKIGVTYTLGVIGMLYMYYHYATKKPEVLYRVIPLKSYDDIPLILFLLKSLKDSGLSVAQSLKILSTEKDFSIGLRKMYSKMSYAIEANRPLYEALEKLHFPTEIMIWIQTAEMSGTLWDKMDKIIDFVNKRNKQKLSFVEAILQAPMTILGYVIVIYFIIGLFFSIFVLQRIAMSLG